MTTTVHVREGGKDILGTPIVINHSDDEPLQGALEVRYPLAADPCRVAQLRALSAAMLQCLHAIRTGPYGDRPRRAASIAYTELEGAFLRAGKAAFLAADEERLRE